MALHRFIGMEIGVPEPHGRHPGRRRLEPWELGEFATWGPNQPPHEFAFPAALEAIGKAREAEGR